MKKEKSDFGKGFVYNLILFAAHFDRNMSGMKGLYKYNLWFNGASDHLYEFEIPEKFKNTLLGKKARKLQKIALEIGHGKRMMEKDNEKDFIECVKLTKEIGLLIDKELDINPIKGRWE